MCFSLSQYVLFLPLGMPLHYRHAFANNLKLLNILNATPVKYVRPMESSNGGLQRGIPLGKHFTGQVCLHMVSHMFLRIVVNLTLYAPSYI